MNRYEVAVVLSSVLTDEARASELELIKGYITKYGGTVAEVDEWGKKKLAYEIQKMDEGFYYFIHFESETDAPAQIEDHVRIMDNVLRFLIVRPDEEQPAPKKEEKSENE